MIDRYVEQPCKWLLIGSGTDPGWAGGFTTRTLASNSYTAAESVTVKFWTHPVFKPCLMRVKSFWGWHSNLHMIICYMLLLLSNSGLIIWHQKGNFQLYSNVRCFQCFSAHGAGWLHLASYKLDRRQREHRSWVLEATMMGDEGRLAQLTTS